MSILLLLAGIVLLALCHRRWLRMRSEWKQAVGSRHGGTSDVLRQWGDGRSAGVDAVSFVSPDRRLGHR